MRLLRSERSFWLTERWRRDLIALLAAAVELAPCIAAELICLLCSLIVFVLSVCQVDLLLKIGFTITASGRELFCELVNPLLVGFDSGLRLAGPGIELFSLRLGRGRMFRSVAQPTGEGEIQFTICYLHCLLGESLFVRARGKSGQGPSGLKGMLVDERSLTTRCLSGVGDRLLRLSGQNEPDGGRQDKAE